MFRKWKLVILPLFLCLCLVLAVPVGVKAALRPLSVMNQQYPLSMTVVGGQVYTLTGSTLEMLPVNDGRVGTPQHVGILSEENLVISSWGSQLFALALRDNNIHLCQVSIPERSGDISLAQVGNPVDCSAALPEAADTPLAVVSDFVMTGPRQAAVLIQDITWKSWLVWMDFSTETCRMLPVQNGTDLAGTPDGAVYVLTDDHQVLRINLEAGSAASLFSLPAPAACLATGDQPDTLYAVDHAHVYRYAPETGFIEIDPSPFQTVNPEMQGCMIGGAYLMLGDTSIYLSDPTLVEYPYITIGSSVDANLKTQYELENNILIQEVDTFVFSDQRFIQDMINRDSTIDLFVLNTSWISFPSLLDKGYYTPLDGSIVLSDTMDTFDPALAAYFRRDNQICAFPIRGDVSALCLSKEAMEILDIRKENLPTNFDDLIPWLNKMSDTAKDHNIQLFASGSSPRSFAAWKLFDLYNHLCEYNGEPVDFLSHRFPELLRLIDETFKDNESTSLPWVNDEPPMALMDTLPLHQPALINGKEIMHLSLSADDPIVLPVRFTAYVLNPHSQKKDMALDFLAYAAQHLDDSARLLLNHGPIEPVESPDYQEIHQNALDRLHLLNEKLRTVSPAEKRALEEQIEDEESYIETLENFRWLISPAYIVSFNQHRNHFLATGGYPLVNVAEDQISKLLLEFYDGAIHADQLLVKLQELSRMISLEME